MRKIESGSIRMSKPFGAVAPSFKPSVPLFYGGCTVLSIQPSTSVLSAQALAALKYAFLQNKKVGITGAKVESLKPPCDSDLDKAEAAYSIARELVEWSEKFAVDEASQLSDQACLETKDDHKMSDKASDPGYSLDAKDEKDALFGARKSGDVKHPEIKDSEIKDPEVKLERFDEFKDVEYSISSFEKDLDECLMPIKAEPASLTERSIVGSRTASRTASRVPETPNFLKETGCDGFDFFKSSVDTDYNTDYNALSLLSYSSSEPMSSLDDLTQHTVDIDLAFPVPPLPVFPKMDSDRFDDLYSAIESPQSPLLSPFSTSPNSPFPSFPDS